MAFTPFPPRQPSSSSRLPLTLMTLDDWALATITGQDGEKYLQGQITADVSALTDDRHLLAAHCDAKGKMWSNLRVFRRDGGFTWIERRSLRDSQLAELKKYAVFSKVTIAADDEHVLLGVAGFQARAALAPLFSELPGSDKPLVSDGVTSLLWFAGDRCGNRHPRNRRVAQRCAVEQQPAVAGAQHRSRPAGHRQRQQRAVHPAGDKPAGIGRHQL